MTGVRIVAPIAIDDDSPSHSQHLKCWLKAMRLSITSLSIVNSLSLETINHAAIEFHKIGSKNGRMLLCGHAQHAEGSRHHNGILRLHRWHLEDITVGVPNFSMCSFM